jgi:hypothetical protein
MSIYAESPGRKIVDCVSSDATGSSEANERRWRDARKDTIKDWRPGEYRFYVSGLEAFVDVHDHEHEPKGASMMIDHDNYNLKSHDIRGCDVTVL